MIATSSSQAPRAEPHWTVERSRSNLSLQQDRLSLELIGNPLIGPLTQVFAEDNESVRKGTEAAFASGMNRLRKILCAAIMAAAVWPAVAGTISSDLKSTLSGLGLFGSTTVIVQFDGSLSGQLLNLVTGTGAKILYQLPLINGLVCSVTSVTAPLLAAVPGVKYMTPDRALTAKLDYAQPTTNASVARKYGWTGAGISIAVIDSGITAVTDLNESGGSKSRIVYSQNFADSTTNTSDQYGHGTHVAGIAAGNGANSTGAGYTKTFFGIAPAATLVNLKSLNSSGQGTDSTVIRAIQQAVNLKAQYNIRVINLSLGRPIYESFRLDPLCQAVEKAWASGIVVVLAAGNNGRDNSRGTNGYATINSPANDPHVITVGAMKTVSTISRNDDLIASYSSKGPTLLDHFVKPDLVAPGNNVISLLAPNGSIDTTYPQNAVLYSYYKTTGTTNTSTAYFRLSGTSMASPMVAGAAALLLQQNPALTSDQVKARLMKTATKTFPATSIAIDPITGQTYSSQYDVFTVGAGYLDIWAALNNSDVINGSARSPVATYDASKGDVYLTVDSGSTWNTSAVWGDSAVWGNNAFINGSSAIWGDSAIWGTQTSTGFSAVWGDSGWAPNQTSTQATQIAVSGEK